MPGEPTDPTMTTATPANDDDDPPPPAPVEPDLEACCGNGCDPCIFDLYDLERERHRQALRAWQQRRALRGTPPAG